MDDTYRIDELAEQAAAALVASGTVPPSARVSALPDRRMLRYYTTLGLLDRPDEVRGRTAYYGRRHLLQIVAIKRLQAGGATLTEVQQQLAGASTADLERIADLRSTPPAPHRPFWREAPPPATPSAAAAAAAPPAAAPPAAPAATRPEPVAVRLAPGVTLVVDAARPIPPDRQGALRTAAAPLLDHLAAYLKES